MDADGAEWERQSLVRVLPPVAPRKLAKVPFVELADGRLQGVVSSSSDVRRVYVSSIAAGTHAFSCSTNNNRPCGGASDRWMCNHLDALVRAAEEQYGVDRVVRYLRIDGGDEPIRTIGPATHLRGTRESQPAAVVFSRFLRHLTYLEVPATTEPLPEMQWFPATRAVG